METQPLVSICCTTYNHAKYIKDAIEGFLMQETDFPYEIIIHDDASTDGTVAIIRGYAEKNPNIIPILQKENQYSKGVKISSTFIYPIIRGKYIALCEGDDFWTDPRKLQKQIGYMEKNPECTLCIHASSDISRTGEFIKERRRYKYDRSVSAEDIIFYGGGFCATASTVYPSVFAFERPPYFAKSPVGDVPLHIFLASKGETYYFHDNMSNYRAGVPDSWTSRVGDGPLETQLKHQEAMVDMYKSFDEFTEHKYHRIVQFMAAKCEIHAFRIKRKLGISGTNIFIAVCNELAYIKFKLSIHIYRCWRKMTHK